MISDDGRGFYESDPKDPQHFTVARDGVRRLCRAADGEVTVLDATAVQRWLANLPCPDGIGRPL